MRPIEYWLTQLPLDIAQRAYQNIELSEMCVNCVLNDLAPDIESALLLAFDWESSTEGFEYWAGILNAYRINGFDPDTLRYIINLN